MKPFRDLLIRRKLMLLMMASSCFTLFVACVAWVYHDWLESRKSLVAELTVMAQIVGDSAAPAIDFMDVEQMINSLRVVGDQPHVRQAVLFDEHGEILATYWSQLPHQRSPAIRHQPAGYRTGRGIATVYRDIVYDGKRLGTIGIEADLAGIWERQAHIVGIVLFVLLLCLAIAIVMSFKLTGVISRPVVRLTDTMRLVSERKDYSLRARKHGRDEVGFLTDAFNQMLAAIQDRDAELERHGNTLEDQVSQRTSELTEKAEQLRISMEEARGAALAKSQFLANMSHEIRTPMNGILGMNELLLDSPLSEQQRSYGEIVKSSAESLLEIINDILDFSKIEAGKLRLEEIEFEPYKTVEEVISLLSGPAHKKGLDLVCWIAPNIPPVLRGDPTRFRQVITNLVGNAVKFTDHGRISVRAEHAESDDQTVLVKVLIEDTGIGISRDHQQRLFRSFSQIDASTTRKYGGTGLGLAISRQLVELMGGELEVASELGVGSSFWFTARFEKLPDENFRSFILPDGFEGPRLLIADSSAAIREVLHQQFEAWGIEHEVAGDAARAFSALRKAQNRETPFELVLLDDHVLADAGDDLLPLLQEAEEGFDTRVVLMSWSGAEQVEVPAGIEVHGRLNKPIRPSQLFDVVLMHARQDTTIESDDLDRITDEVPASMLRVLLAEDNSINQLVATKILARGGYACEVVGDGLGALQAVAEGAYDLILMDCQMPLMDGFESTRQIRQWELETGRVDPVHIIALTANAMKGDRERCIDAGMNDYLSKPVKPEVLLDKLRQYQVENKDLLARRHGHQHDAPSDPFDADDMLDRYKGKYDELRAAIAKMDSTSIDCLGRLKYCLRAEYADDAQDLVRELREALALISSERLHAMAVGLERLAGQGQFAAALRRFEDLHDEFERCRAFLPEVVARIGYA